MSKSELNLTVVFNHPEGNPDRPFVYIESITSEGSEIGLYLSERLMMMMSGYVNQRMEAAGRTDQAAKSIPKDAALIEGSPSVYVLHDKLRDTYKIGYSKQPAIREKTLQAEVPSIERIATYPGSMDDEKELHRRFASLRLRGEWFRLNSEHLLAIEEYFKLK